jgi:hypothetical protein
MVSKTPLVIGMPLSRHHPERARGYSHVHYYFSKPPKLPAAFAGMAFEDTAIFWDVMRHECPNAESLLIDSVYSV